MGNLTAATRFVRLVVINTSTKLADILISAKTTLPWLLSTIGAPAWIVSALVPIREAGALIPQWPVKNATSDIRNRLILWRWGAVTQAIAIAGMIPAALLFEASVAGIAILLLLAGLSLGRSLCSLTMKDIQGHNISKGKRGKLGGMAATLSGLLSLLTAAMLLLGENWFGQTALLAMLGLASILFMLTLPLSTGLDTRFEQSADNDTSIADLTKTLASDVALRQLVISRSLMLHGALVAPFFISISISLSDNGFSLPYFIAASALASFLSSYLWGKLSDDSAVLSLRLGGVICVLACSGFALLVTMAPNLVAIIGFFILNVGYAGIRNGRKTYVLDIAEDAQRSKYVATSNTLVGVVLLILGGLYAVLYHYLAKDIVWVMTAMLALGTGHTHILKREK